MEYKQIGVRLRPQIFDGLTELSRKTRISKTVLVEMALKRACEAEGITVDCQPVEQPRDYAI